MTGIRPAQHGQRVRRMTAVKLAKAIVLLQSGAWTINRLADAVDVSRHALLPHINAWRGTLPRLVYVAEWEVTREAKPIRYTAAYSWGNKRNAERPAKKSRNQLCQEYRARKKQRAVDAVILGVSR